MADGYANEYDVTKHRPMEERAAAQGHLTSQSAAACVEHLRWRWRGGGGELGVGGVVCLGRGGRKGEADRGGGGH